MLYRIVCGVLPLLSCIVLCLSFCRYCVVSYCLCRVAVIVLYLIVSVVLRGSSELEGRNPAGLRRERINATKRSCFTKEHCSTKERTVGITLATQTH